MAINKIVLSSDDGDRVLVDLTEDTVTPETLAVGVTAHGANGEPIVGTMRSGEDLDAVLTEQEELIAELQDTLRGKVVGGEVVDPVIEPLEITENGTYTAPEGVDGYSPVTVNVPIPDGYIQPSGELEIVANGEYDVTEKASVVVVVPEREIVLQDKEITENGTYTADDGYDGLGQVVVNVAGGGPTEPDPSEQYQRVEYIQSTTGCRIDSDIFADNETGMELIAKYPTLADRVPMGSRLDGNATRYYAPYPLSANSFYYGFNAGVTKSTGAVANRLYRSSLNFLNNRVSTVKEEDTNAIEFADALTSTLSQQTAPIGIFCYLRVTSGAVTLQSSRDIVFCRARISQGEEIIREYIPCYRKSDGEIGLYEKYTGQFLANQGSGTFTVGADIDW